MSQSRIESGSKFDPRLIPAYDQVKDWRGQDLHTAEAVRNAMASKFAFEAVETGVSLEPEYSSIEQQALKIMEIQEEESRKKMQERETQLAAARRRRRRRKQRIAGAVAAVIASPFVYDFVHTSDKEKIQDQVDATGAKVIAVAKDVKSTGKQGQEDNGYEVLTRYKSGNYKLFDDRETNSLILRAHRKDQTYNISIKGEFDGDNILSGGEVRGISVEEHYEGEEYGSIDKDELDSELSCDIEFGELNRNNGNVDGYALKPDEKDADVVCEKLTSKGTEKILARFDKVVGLILKDAPRSEVDKAAGIKRHPPTQPLSDSQPKLPLPPEATP